MPTYDRETLTRGEAQVVINDLKKEFDRIQSEVKNGNLFGAAVDTLKQKSDLIQSKLNELLKKRGLITEEDFNESYNLIRAKSENELLNLQRKAKKNTTIFLVSALAAGVILYLLLRKK